MDKSLRKNGAGSHNWGSYKDELELERSHSDSHSDFVSILILILICSPTKFQLATENLNLHLAPKAIAIASHAGPESIEMQHDIDHARTKSCDLN